jgi:hypothetical protein
MRWGIHLQIRFSIVLGFLFYVFFYCFLKDGNREGFLWPWRGY